MILFWTKTNDDFQKFVSSTPNFPIGFRSTQQWIVSREDLNTMYASAKDGEITCDKKIDSLEQSWKRKSAHTEDSTPASKANDREQ